MPGPPVAFRRMTDRTSAELAVREFAETALRESAGDLLATLHLMMGRLHERVEPIAEGPPALPDAVLAAGRGTIVDLAHLFTAARSSWTAVHQCRQRRTVTC